ncbi:MAG: hypothetical protein FWD24_04105 [Treponema sp.]|nr:hypothetical protein [Treponema sp.]
MIGFLIKKTLYDLWDNLFKIVILNLGFIGCTAIPIFLPVFGSLFSKSESLYIILTVLGLFACSIYLSAVSFVIRAISDYSTFTFRDFFAAFKIAWPSGLVMGFLLILLYLVITVIIPFYWVMENPLMGLALSSIVFWLTLFAIISFQFYFTVYARLGQNLKKAFKKSMLISMDNTGMSIFLFIHNTLALALSVICLFLFPGPVGVLLYLDQAIRLRLLKYDWLEANPDANRRKIPWDAILIEERERTGNRTLKNLIFPWKD